MPEHSSTSTRRTVLRVGAHVAWAVPAITLATAAPALATSPSTPAPSLSFTQLSVVGPVDGDPTSFEVKVTGTVTNGGTATASSVTVSFSGAATGLVSGSESLGDIAANGSASFSVIVKLTDGTRAVGANSTTVSWADKITAQAAPSDGKGSTSGDVAVPDWTTPVLTVTSVTASKATNPTSGGDIFNSTVTYTIHNAGSDQATLNLGAAAFGKGVTLVSASPSDLTAIACAPGDTTVTIVLALDKMQATTKSKNNYTWSSALSFPATMNWFAHVAADKASGAGPAAVTVKNF